MEELKKIHDPAKGVLKIAVFMSGTGSNADAILRSQEDLKRRIGKYLYKVEVIFTDCADSKAC